MGPAPSHFLPGPYLTDVEGSQCGIQQQPCDEEDYAPEIPECRLKKESEIFWYNLACGLFHLIQAAAVLALGLGNSTLGKFKLPLTTLFTIWPKGYPQQQLIVRGYLPFVAATSGFAWMSAIAHFRSPSRLAHSVIYSLSLSLSLPFSLSLSLSLYRASLLAHIRTIALILTLFLILSHLLSLPLSHCSSSVLIGFPCYIADLRKGINRYRWVEYAFSSSWIIALIAMLFGVYDILTLVLLASCNAAMIWFGWLMETTNIGEDE